MDTFRLISNVLAQPHLILCFSRPYDRFSPISTYKINSHGQYPPELPLRLIYI